MYTSTLVNTGIKYIEDEPSNRLKLILRNVATLNGLTALDLQVSAFSGGSAPSTIARIIAEGSNSRIDWKYLPDCVEWVAHLTGTAPLEIAGYIMSGNNSVPSLAELFASRFYRPTQADLRALRVKLKHRFTRVLTHWMLCDTVPSPLLDESVFQKILRGKVADMEAPLQRFRVELEHWKSISAWLRGCSIKHGIILTRTGLDWLFHEKRPGHLSSDQRNRVIETLIDFVEIKGALLFILDDGPGRAGAQIRPYLETYELREVFDGTLSLRLRRNTLMRSLYDGSESPAQSEMVQHDSYIIDLARRHAISDWQLIRRILLQFASNDCWLNLREKHQGSI